MEKIRASKITITRAEGPIPLCGVAVSFVGSGCWEESRRYLYQMSSTFPREGGYDKHDFTVEFEDGDTWEGRLDCQHHTCDDPDLNVAKHVKQVATFYAGRRCPSHLTEDRYRAFLSQHPESVTRMETFLEKYEVPA